MGPSLDGSGHSEIMLLILGGNVYNMCNTIKGTSEPPAENLHNCLRLLSSCVIGGWGAGGRFPRRAVLDSVYVQNRLCRRYVMQKKSY